MGNRVSRAVLRAQREVGPIWVERFKTHSVYKFKTPYNDVAGAFKITIIRHSYNEAVAERARIVAALALFELCDEQQLRHGAWTVWGARDEAWPQRGNAGALGAVRVALRLIEEEAARNPGRSEHAAVRFVA